MYVRNYESMLRRIRLTEYHYHGLSQACAKLKLDAPQPETAGRANQIGAPQSCPAFDNL